MAWISSSTSFTDGPFFVVAHPLKKLKLGNLTPCFFSYHKYRSRSDTVA